MTQDTFSGYHPFVNLIYFALVLLFTMFWMHPLCLAVSLSCACAYLLVLKGVPAMKQQLFYLIPIALSAAILNPVFNHEGATILIYLPTGNPLTLESLVYGASAATLLAAVILWCSCLGAVMSTDKLVYLFGRVAPTLSLLLSMSLRFVPRFMEQLQCIIEGQRGLGRDISKGTVLQRAKLAIKILSILITWALENAIHTADSMNSRGYGLPKRTSFSIYRIQRRDKLVLAWLIGCALFLLWGWKAGALVWRYYPTIYGTISLKTFLFLLVYLFLCLTPVILSKKEAALWKSLQSET